MGGCIFIPLYNKYTCIGIIRQYYYNKIGQNINN